MARYTEQGTFFTTDDLIRMAQLESFGTYSYMVGRALVRLKAVEEENKHLRELVRQLQEVEVQQQNNEELPAGNVINPLM